MQPFWMIYHAVALDEGCENAALLNSIGTSFEKLEATLDDWGQADAVLVEYEQYDDDLANPRIIGHLNEGKEALLTSVSRAVVPAGEWQTHLTPIG